MTNSTFVSITFLNPDFNDPTTTNQNRNKIPSLTPPETIKRG